MTTVLGIRCYTGYSALACYEGTKNTRAEIITLKLGPKMIAANRITFDKYGLKHRIKLLERPAKESMKKLSGTFDIIFLEANTDGYENYVKSILDMNSLAPRGGLLCAIAVGASLPSPL